MIINKEEIEKAAEEYCNTPYRTELEKQQAYRSFIAGERLAEDKFNEMFLDIITENQGLKLYKDNEPKRFKNLAVEFLEWYQKNTVMISGEINYWNTYHEEWVLKSNEELYDLFLKEKMKKRSKFKRMIQDIVSWTVLSLCITIILITFFSPLIISALTGNWWFLLLFCVSYIPVIFEIVFMQIIYSLYNNL
jgi:hypothetical protein